MPRKTAVLLTLFVAISTLAGLLAFQWNVAEPAAGAVAVDISDQQFAQLIEELSEPEGFFDSDNFVSNETSYLHVIGGLKERVRPGFVYFGVGPDQNFTYIAHAQPSLAFILDIRRQNMLQHLLFKALMEQSSDRYDYLTRLFARGKLEAPDDGNLEELLRAIRLSPVGGQEKQIRENLAGVRKTLVDRHRLRLSAGDLSKIENVYRTFVAENLDLRFSSLGRPSFRRYPSLEELILETDRSGRHQSYLASEELFQRIRQMQIENRIVPVVGDFAGDKAFKAIGQFLRDNGLSVSLFYVSNVEFYLFGRPVWEPFVENVRGLPMTEGAFFIRAYFSSFGRPHPMHVVGHRSTTLLQSAQPFLDDAVNGRLRSYWDVVSRHYQ